MNPPPQLQFCPGTWAALYLAAEFNYVGIARILLDYDADPDLGLERGGETPIHVAAERDHASIVEVRPALPVCFMATLV